MTQAASSLEAKSISKELRKMKGRLLKAEGSRNKEVALGKKGRLVIARGWQADDLTSGPAIPDGRV